ncbi:MAG: DUF2723 domain-containing protein, partial [Chloroflexi bacterium]|nr:DUF2723 domain-containing protein [Chloroflexota bacterium]
MIARWSNAIKSGWLYGLILGLYLGRVLAESAPMPWRAVPLLLLALASVAVGLVAAQLLRRVAERRIAERHMAERRVTTRLWPLGLLLVYVLWPWAWPALAGALALAVVSLLLLLHVSPRAASWWPEVLVLAGALGLYLSTLAPGVLPADSGEFQLVSGVLGIAHPPGYALYTLLGKLFTLLPVGSVAYRVNLFGAVCGALALAVITRSVRRETGSMAAGLAAALAAALVLGLSATFWAQSVSANIRSLTALFTALCLALLLRWGALVRAEARAGEARASRYLLALGVCFGLAVGHHSSLALLALPFVAYILLSAPGLLSRPRQWAPALGGFAASFVVLLYLPIRSRMGAPFDPEPIRTWSDFVEHVLASGFRGDMFYFRSLPDLAARLGVWRNVMTLQFGPLLPWIMLLAAWPIARRNPRALVLLGGTWAVNTLTALTYRAPQTVEYLLPSYVALALLLGYGLGLALRRPALEPGRALADGGLAADVAATANKRGSAHPARWLQAAAHAFPVAVTVAVLLAAVWQGMSNYPDFRALHADRSAEEYAQTILEDAPQDALILANWHYATAFWYMQTVEGQRPDVQVTYVYPEGSLPNEQVWLRRVEEALSHRPVIVTNWFYAYESTPYHWLPFHGAWLAQEEPMSAPPDYAITRAGEFAGPVRVLGYELDTENPAPGETVSLRVYWQPTGSWDRDYSAFVQLLGPGGVVGQGDIRHTPQEFVPGEVRVDAYRFPLLLHTPPGEYRLITGFYYTDDAGWHRLSVDGAPAEGDAPGSGGDHLELTRLTVRPADSALPTLHPTDQQFAGGLRLTGVDYDRGVSGQTRVYLHWRQDNPLPLSLGPWKSATGAPVVARLWLGDDVVAQGALPALAPGAATTVALDVPADARDLRLDLVTDAGAPVTRLGPWHRAVAMSTRLRVPLGAQRYVPLGGQMAFVGLGNPAAAVGAGESVWLRPRFLALRPLVTDSTVSVGVR